MIVEALDWQGGGALTYASATRLTAASMLAIAFQRATPTIRSRSAEGGARRYGGSWVEARPGRRDHGRVARHRRAAGEGGLRLPDEGELLWRRRPADGQPGEPGEDGRVVPSMHVALSCGIPASAGPVAGSLSLPPLHRISRRYAYQAPSGVARRAKGRNPLLSCAISPPPAEWTTSRPRLVRDSAVGSPGTSQDVRPRRTARGSAARSKLARRRRGDWSMAMGEHVALDAKLASPARRSVPGAPRQRFSTRRRAADRDVRRGRVGEGGWVAFFSTRHGAVDRPARWATSSHRPSCTHAEGRR